MSKPSEDPVEEMAVGETRTLSGETSFDTHEAMWDEFVGWDRKAEDVRVEDTFVEDGEVVVRIAGDVTKIDPKTKPVFQSEERWNSRSDTAATTSSSWPWWAKVAMQTIPTLAVSAFVAWVSTRIIDAADITVNGEGVAAPGWLGVFFVMVTIVAVVMGMQYLPRPSGGVRR